MSYQNWANYGWMIPATRENAEKLGITDRQLKEIDPEFDFDDWDESLFMLSENAPRLWGSVDGTPFSIDIVFIGSDAEIDCDMDGNVSYWFEIYHSALYTKTPLFDPLMALGVKHYSWVSGG